MTQAIIGANGARFSLSIGDSSTAGLRKTREGAGEKPGEIQSDRRNGSGARRRAAAVEGNLDQTGNQITSCFSLERSQKLQRRRGEIDPRRDSQMRGEETNRARARPIDWGMRFRISRRRGSIAQWTGADDLGARHRYATALMARYQDVQPESLKHQHRDAKPTISHSRRLSMRPSKGKKWQIP
jgi:hypothetical protein